LSRNRRSEADGAGGFTVIEAVVALALVAVLLSAIGSLVATNSRGVRGLEQHVALMETARLIATGLPRNGEPLPDELAGSVSGYRWQMRLSPFADQDGAVPDSRFAPVRIELVVRSPSGATVSFETVRLQSKGGP
jgi:general secretion pathway protein I